MTVLFLFVLLRHPAAPAADTVRRLLLLLLLTLVLRLQLLLSRCKKNARFVTRAVVYLHRPEGRQAEAAAAAAAATVEAAAAHPLPAVGCNRVSDFPTHAIFARALLLSIYQQVTAEKARPSAYLGLADPECPVLEQVLSNLVLNNVFTRE